MDKYIKQNLPKELELDEIKKVKDLPFAKEAKFPILIDKNFDNYIQKFMHSYREKEHPTININNLLILNGAEKSGKSWFLRKNLKSFEEAKGNLKNLVIHYDIRDIPASSFNSFLFAFEKAIIQALVSRNDYERGMNNKEILTQNDLLDLLFYRWEKGWIEINLSKSLKRAIAENDTAYTYTINKSEHYSEILEMIEKYEKKSFKEYILIENFARLSEIIETSLNITSFEASLLLIYDCLIQREDIRKPEKIFDNELYRDGIDVMEYFFDIICYFAGYHDIQNKKAALTDVDEKRHLYPHVVLALESVQELFNMNDAERRPLDYMHKIMLRLYVIFFFK